MLCSCVVQVKNVNITVRIPKLMMNQICTSEKNDFDSLQENTKQNGNKVFSVIAIPSNPN